MTLRKIVSLTALVSFALLMVTSIVLFIVPAGRVAYWTDWRLWLLSKQQWGAVHTNLGFLLLIALVLHIGLNWQAIVGYLKNRAKALRIFTADFNAALAVTLLVCAGTLAGIPPLRSIVDLGAAISDRANLRYGEPPYGHAELSPLEVFTERVKLDLKESMARLKAAGIRFDGPKQTLAQIAEANGVTAQQVYLAMQPAVDAGSTAMPEVPLAGTGNRTLALLCQMYRLDAAEIVTGLAARGIEAEPGLTIKAIARANSLDPHGLYAAIREMAQTP